VEVPADAQVAIGELKAVGDPQTRHDARERT
jgi:hypothetical protein